MSDTFLHEERLLNLIKGQKEEKLSDDKITLPENRFFDSGPDKSKLLGNDHDRLLNVLKSRNVIFGLSSVAGIFLLSLLYFSFLGPKSPMGNKNEIIPKTDDKINSGANLSLSAGVIDVQPTKSAVETVSSEPLLEQVQIANLTLTGVVLGDDSQAIIFDKNTEKTYYVSEGEAIGDISVKNILDDKVVLSYKGSELELVM